MKSKFRHPSFPITALAFGGAAFLLLTAPLRLEAFSFQPPPNRTGAPGGGGLTCAECHTGTGGGSLSIGFSDGEETYVPGESYTLNVMINDSGQSRFGFSMAAREDATPTMPVGEWAGGQNSAPYDGGEHIGHQEAPFSDNSHTFEVTWTAPATDVGSITFYAAGNAANGNGINDQGDHVYQSSLTVEPATTGSGSFWADSPASADGWRYSGEAYENEPGIGWIWDGQWPWIYTLGHGDPQTGDWVYVLAEGGSRESGFWGYHATGGYWFWGVSSFGWYYSFAEDDAGWFPYNL